MICSLRFKKDFVLLVLKLYPHPSCYLFSIVAKTHHGPVIALFSAQLLQHFSYVEGVLVSKLQTFFHYYRLTHFGYLANYNIRETFLSIFLICSKMMNCLRSLGPNRSPKKNINKNYQTIFRPYFYFL